MPQHFLIPENAGTTDPWILEWSDTVLTLTSPDGVCVIETAANLAHRLIDQIELYEEETICFQLPHGEIRFPARLDALYEMKFLISNGLRHDPEYRAASRRRARWLILVGFLVSAISAFLFGLFFWWASWAPDPPEGHWLHTAGPFIRKGLIVLLGLAIGGPLVSLKGYFQLRRIKKIDREIGNHDWPTNEPG